MTATEQDLFDQLTFYTLAHGDPRFLHQHAVDAFAAQRATGETKPIKITFALVGLYLFLEKGFTGREVQRVHMRLAARRKSWPRPEPPAERGEITIADVVQVPAGPERDRAIERWCASVWRPYQVHRELIASLLQQELEIR